MKSPVELLFYFFIIYLLIFVISRGLMRRHTGGLTNEVFIRQTLLFETIA